jgi:voltage-gated potassium channel Kch
MPRIRKFIMGHQSGTHAARSPLKNHIFALLRIWRNYTHTDYGLERAFRLLLASLQFLSLGLWVRQLFRGLSIQERKVVLEVYVLCKMLFPLVLLMNGLYYYSWGIYIVFYLMIETIVYLMSFIFLSDATRESISPKRSLLLLFVNFFEIVLYFAYIYYHFDVRHEAYFSCHFNDYVDAIYFSFVTAGTVGYGDIVPLAPLAKKLAIAQITLTFVFVALFLNYFNTLLHRSNHSPNELRHRKTRHAREKKES